MPLCMPKNASKVSCALWISTAGLYAFHNAPWNRSWHIFRSLLSNKCDEKQVMRDLWKKKNWCKKSWDSLRRRYFASLRTCVWSLLILEEMHIFIFFIFLISYANSRFFASKVRLKSEDNFYQFPFHTQSQCWRHASPPLWSYIP